MNKAPHHLRENPVINKQRNSSTRTKYWPFSQFLGCFLQGERKPVGTCSQLVPTALVRAFSPPPASPHSTPLLAGSDCRKRRLAALREYEDRCAVGVGETGQEGTRNAADQSPLSSHLQLAGRKVGPNDRRFLSAKRWSPSLPLSARADS
jgi:hypothetical protein